MKSLKKTSINQSRKVASEKSRKNATVKLHIVSEKERDLYRVPSYGYLIP